MVKFLFVLALLSGKAKADDSDVLAKLNALPGVKAEEKTSADDSSKKLRRFAVTIEQLTDHRNPRGGKFQQKLVLFHRGYSEPMVLQTSGYVIFGERLSRLASSFGANQIQVEHRFFGDSVPDPKDWSKLTVKQSADDFHHIVEVFKKVYPGRWVNTGASKGGMTSVFHRRFYPNDLDGTVADVAPFSYSVFDERYIPFVDQVGGAEFADCRRKLEALQVGLLRRTREVLPEIDGNYADLGDIQIAYEQAVTEMPFVFWQYGSPSDCARVPSPDGSTSEIASFLKSANHPNSYDNANLAIFQPYFFQAAVELGAPGAKLSHIERLLKFPYVMDPLLPRGVPARYSNRELIGVREWVQSQGKGLMFVYGEFDPWTAGAFERLNANADNHQFIVPKGNHGSNYTALSGAARTKAMEVLSRWFGKTAVEPVNLQGLFPQEDQSLEALELQALRRARLR